MIHQDSFSLWMFIFFLFYASLCILQVIYQTRETAFHPNIEERVENTTLSLMFDISSQSKQKLRSKSSKSRENDGTEREAQGVGRDMSCPRKLFLT